MKQTSGMWALISSALHKSPINANWGQLQPFCSCVYRWIVTGLPSRLTLLLIAPCTHCGNSETRTFDPHLYICVYLLKVYQSIRKVGSTGASDPAGSNHFFRNHSGQVGQRVGPALVNDRPGLATSTKTGLLLGRGAGGRQLGLHSHQRRLVVVDHRHLPHVGRVGALLLLGKGLSNAGGAVEASVRVHVVLTVV